MTLLMLRLSEGSGGVDQVGAAGASADLQLSEEDGRREGGEEETSTRSSGG